MIKKQMKLCENLLIYFFQDVKQAQRKLGKGGFFFFFFLVLSIYCITNVKNKFEIREAKRR